MGDEGDSAQEPFLAKELRRSEDLPSEKLDRDERSPWTARRFILLQSALIILYSIVSLAFIGYAREPCQACASSQSPIEDVKLEYKPKSFTQLTHSPYFGGLEKDAEVKWRELLSPRHLRVTDEELRKTNQVSISLPEGGGNLAWFGVFHALHCIEMLYETSQRTTGSHEQEHESHTGHFSIHLSHCVELLRMQTMCRPDLSLTTFKWSPRKNGPVLNNTESVHECVDWDRFVDSFKHRVLPSGEINRLQNSLLS